MVRKHKIRFTTKNNTFYLLLFRLSLVLVLLVGSSNAISLSDRVTKLVVVSISSWVYDTASCVTLLDSVTQGGTITQDVMSLSQSLIGMGRTNNQTIGHPDYTKRYQSCLSNYETAKQHLEDIDGTLEPGRKSSMYRYAQGVREQVLECKDDEFSTSLSPPIAPNIIELHTICLVIQGIAIILD
ncbi:hypothetical protein LINGRAHAP2_LOCUS8000 [Linum grandiflorum]